MSSHEAHPRTNRLPTATTALIGGGAVALLHQYNKTRRLRQENRQLDRWTEVLSSANQELHERAKRLHRIATHDSLTGLLNRVGLEEALLSSPQPVALLYVDGNNQKAVNDLINHDRGDEAIRGTAAVLQKSLRQQDIIARIGGDEFLGIINRQARPNGQTIVREPEEVLETVTSRIAQETAAYLDANPDLSEIAGFNLSVGTAIWNPGMSIDQVRQLAESNMYLVKTEQHQADGQYRSAG